MKNSPEGAELFHADGRTDRREEVNSNFSLFCEKLLSPKNAENVHKAEPFWPFRVIAAILATNVTRRLLVTLETKITVANT